MTPPRKLPDPADPDTTAPADQAPAADDARGDGAHTFAGGIPVDPGPAYRAGDQAAAAADADPQAVPATALVAPQLVTHDQAVMALRALWGLMRVGVKLTGGGPDDVFQPTSGELRDQAEPLLAIANRYPIVALLISQSDYAAALILIGGYAAGEVQRVGEYRSGDAEPAGWAEPSAPASAGVREGVGQPSRAGAWQPHPPPPPPSPPTGPSAGEPA